jgi:hypothetical protein
MSYLISRIRASFRFILLGVSLVACQLSVPPVEKPAGLREYKMTHMAERGYDFSIRIKTPEHFKTDLEIDSRIPVTEEDILTLVRALYPARTQQGVIQYPANIVFPDGSALILESGYGVANEILMVALSNPDLSDAAREKVDRIMAAKLPAPPPPPPPLDSSEYISKSSISGGSLNSVCTKYSWAYLENKYCATEHFFASWYSKDIGSTNENALPDRLVYQTLRDLEDAYNKYFELFEREPELYTFSPLLENVIEIKFSNIPGRGVTSSAWRWIEFSSQAWIDSRGSISRPTSAHELFHRIQYTYGYRTLPGHETDDWFGEGTASWAELFVWNQVSSASKVSHFYDFPEQDLVEYFVTENPGKSAGFWFFWDSHLLPGEHAMKHFMEAYQRNGKIEETLNVLLEKVYGPAFFERLVDRYTGETEVVPGSPYRNFSGYLALWRRDKIEQRYDPQEPIDPSGERLETDVVLAFTQQFESSTGGFLPTSKILDAYNIEKNGTAFFALWVDEDLKDSETLLQLDFLEPTVVTDPEIPAQFQLIYVKCATGKRYPGCGLKEKVAATPVSERRKIRNIAPEAYEVVSVDFREGERFAHRRTIELDVESREWDLIYVVVGTEGDQGAIFVKATLEEKPSVVAVVGGSLWDRLKKFFGF